MLFRPVFWPASNTSTAFTPTDSPPDLPHTQDLLVSLLSSVTRSILYALYLTLQQDVKSHYERTLSAPSTTPTLKHHGNALQSSGL